MALKDILVISGQSGLFKYISQSRNYIIVENLADQKRSNIPSTAKISMLEDIAIYTENEDFPLRKVLKKIQEKENGNQAIPHKSPDKDLKKYFEEILPEYDRDRVYTSDIRKVILWYNLLQDMGIVDFENPEEEQDEEIVDESEDKQENAQQEEQID